MRSSEREIESAREDKARALEERERERGPKEVKE